MKHTYSIYIDGPAEKQRTTLKGTGSIRIESGIVQVEGAMRAECSGDVREPTIPTGAIYAYVSPEQTMRVFHNAYPEHTPTSRVAELQRRLQESEASYLALRDYKDALVEDCRRLTFSLKEAEDRAKLAESRLEDAHREHVLSEQTITQLEANLRECVRLLKEAHTCYGNIIPNTGYRIRQREIRELLTALGVWDV